MIKRIPFSFTQVSKINYLYNNFVSFCWMLLTLRKDWWAFHTINDCWAFLRPRVLLGLALPLIIHSMTKLNGKLLSIDQRFPKENNFFFLLFCFFVKEKRKQLKSPCGGWRFPIKYPPHVTDTWDEKCSHLNLQGMTILRSIMQEPSVPNRVGNISKPSARQSFKIIFIPDCTSTLSCTDTSPVNFPYAFSNIIHHNHRIIKQKKSDTQVNLV